MTWFRCFIHGSDFPGELIGKSVPVGFYTTRCVQAATPEEAETQALANIRDEPWLALPEGVSAPDAKLNFEQIIEVREEDAEALQDVGFAFYLMGQDAVDSAEG